MTWWDPQWRIQHDTVVSITWAYKMELNLRQSLNNIQMNAQLQFSCIGAELYRK